MTKTETVLDAHQDSARLPFDEIYSASMVFKKNTPFTLEQARELAGNVEELISFWLLAVPHFHNEKRIACVKVRQPAISSENIKPRVYSLALDIPGIHALYNEREEKGVQTFVEFLVGMGDELRRGSKPRQDGTQKVEGTDAYNALFDQYEVFLRDAMKHPMKCIPGSKVSPKPKLPAGAKVSTPELPVVAPVKNAVPVADKTDIDTPAMSTDYTEDKIRIKMLEEQVAKQKQVIEALTDIIKNHI